MKNILITILLVSAATCCKLKVGAQVVLESPVNLGCEGGHVQAMNLPDGVRLNSNRLEIFDNARVSTGMYPIRIRAQDANGVDERVIVIVIGSQDGTSSVSYQNNAAFAGLGGQGGVRTITFSEQTSSNIRTDATTGSGSGSASTGSGNGAATLPAVELAQPDSGVGALLDSLQVPTSFGPGTGGAPGSGSPAGGSGSPAGGSPSDGSFPTWKFPTGGNPDLPNFTPLTIAGSQAPRTSANRRPVTVDDVKAQAIWDRQMNAARALANLLSIVKQATANKNVAQEEVTKRQTLYDDAVKRQRDAQGVVGKTEGDVNRVKQGIAQLTESIAAIQKRINDLNNQQRDSLNQRTTLNEGLTIAKTQYNDVDYQLTSAQRNLNDAYDLKKARESQCANFDGEIKNAETDKYNKAADADALNRRISDAKYKVTTDTQRVNDLAAQLEAARNDLANSQRTVNDLTNQQATLNNAVNDLTRRVDDLKARKARCSEDIASIDSRIQTLKDKVADLTDKKKRVDEEITSLTTKIQTITSDFDKYPSQVRDYENQLVQLQKNLNYLRNQLPIFQRVQNDAYVNGNSANDAVKIARDNLDAATKRFLSQTKIAEDSTRNIELARIEKEQADQAVEALLRDGAGILPFAAAPSDNGFTAPTVDGNGAVQIKSWVDFVSSGFGAGVKPLFVGDLKTLYAFKLPGQQTTAGGVSGAAVFPGANGAPVAANPTVAVDGPTVYPGANGTPVAANPTALPASVTIGANGQGVVALGAGSGVCAGEGQKAISGFIVGVAPESFKVLSDGGKAFKVSYANCTVAVANQPNYSLKVGDVVVIKGFLGESVAKSDPLNIQATQVACIAQ